MTHENTSKDTIPAGATEETTDTPESGDTYDEDSGAFLGVLSLESPALPPAQLALLVGDYYYIYHAVSRQKTDEAAEKEATKKAFAEIVSEIRGEDSIFPTAPTKR